MELKHQDPVMTSTPLAFRCRQSHDIEVSPIFPVSVAGRKIKSMIPSSSHRPQPVMSRGRRKTDSNLIENESRLSSNIVSEAKPTLLEIMKKTLMIKVQNSNVVEHKEEISEGVDPMETNRNPAAQKNTIKSSTNQEKAHLPDTTCIPDKRTTNAEQSKSSNVEWCMPQKIKKSCLSKRKTNRQQSVVPSVGIRINDSIIEQEIEELSPLELSYPLQKKQRVLKTENKSAEPSTIFVEETMLQSSCADNDNNSASQTYVLSQQNEQPSSKKLCNNNKVNSKHASTNIHPRRMKKEDSEKADKLVKPVHNRSGQNKVDEDTECDNIGETLLNRKPQRRIPPKSTASLKAGRSKKKYIEGNLNDQLNKSDVTQGTKLPSNKRKTEQTITNTHPIKMKTEGNRVITVEQELPSTSTGAQQTEADEVKEGNNNIEKCGESISNTQNISRITLAAEAFLKTLNTDKKCVEGGSDTQNKQLTVIDDAKPPNNKIKRKVTLTNSHPESLNTPINAKKSVECDSDTQLEIIEDAKLPKNKRKIKETLTNSHPKRMKIEGNVKPLKQTKMSRNTRSNQNKSNEEMDEICDKSISCPKPGRRISEKTKTLKPLKVGTNKKNIIEDISDVQLQSIQSNKMTEEGKDFVTKHSNNSEDKEKEVTDNKIVQDETCPMSATVAVNESSKKSGRKQNEPKSKKVPVKRTGLRKRNSKHLTETVVKESPNDLKEKKTIKSVPRENEQVEEDNQIAIPTLKDTENIVAHHNEQVEINSQIAIPINKGIANIEVPSCFGTKKDKMMMKEGAVMHIFIHIGNFVMTGSCTVQPTGRITKASTNTAYFVVKGSATVRLGPMTTIIRCQDVNCSFFIPKNAIFTITNEEELELRMLFTKFLS